MLPTDEDTDANNEISFIRIICIKRVVIVSSNLIRSRFLYVYQNSLLSTQNVYRREAREMRIFPSIKITKRSKALKNFLGKENKKKRGNKHSKQLKIRRLIKIIWLTLSRFSFRRALITSRPREKR